MPKKKKTMPRFINPYTDFGFKKLFGEEASKDLLIDLLNTLLPKKHLIKTLTFRDPEQLGTSASDRRAVFDVYCENAKKEPFIVEMQRAEQEYFKDRSVYYSAHPIREQGQRGKGWNYCLKTVYFIGILDFVFEPEEVVPTLIHEVSLKDKHGKEFYDKLQYIYVQMPVFDKTESELTTRQDKWFYFLKNLPDLDQIPSILKEDVFQKAFQKAEYAALPKVDQRQYEQELDDYRTYMSTIRKAEQDGEARGKAERDIEIARNMKKKGLDSALIAEMTGLSADEIKRLK